MQFVADIRRILRQHGAGAAIDDEGAARMWGALLDDALDAVEVGAILGALAARGETAAELAGLSRAVHERMVHWMPAAPSAAICIPAYGLVPGETPIVALAAILLARFEIPVIVHGILESPCGVSTACVLRNLGVLPSASLAQADDCLRERHVAYVPVQLLSPRLASLLALRARLGVENAAHIVAQALDPARGQSMRLIPSLAGPIGERIDAIVEEHGGDLLSLAWPPGRAAATLAIRPRIDCVRDGERRILFEADAQEVRSAAHQPAEEVHGITRWIERMLAGETPIPVPALNIAAASIYAAGRADDLGQAKAIAAFNAGRLAA